MIADVSEYDTISLCVTRYYWICDMRLTFPGISHFVLLDDTVGDAITYTSAFPYCAFWGVEISTR